MKSNSNSLRDSEDLMLALHAILYGIWARPTILRTVLIAKLRVSAATESMRKPLNFLNHNKLKRQDNERINTG